MNLKERELVVTTLRERHAQIVAQLTGTENLRAERDKLKRAKEEIVKRLKVVLESLAGVEAARRRKEEIERYLGQNDPNWKAGNVEADAGDEEADWGDDDDVEEADKVPAVINRHNVFEVAVKDLDAKCALFGKNWVGEGWTFRMSVLSHIDVISLIRTVTQNPRLQSNDNPKKPRTYPVVAFPGATLTRVSASTLYFSAPAGKLRDLLNCLPEITKDALFGVRSRGWIMPGQCHECVSARFAHTASDEVRRHCRRKGFVVKPECPYFCRTATKTKRGPTKKKK